MIYFAADLHLNHYNSIKYCNRPFVSVDEMNNEILLRWNSRIKQEDSVYLLGDVALGHKNRCKELLDRLNGKIYLIRGNHERSVLNPVCQPRFEWVKALETITPQYKGKAYIIVLCHYALRVWDRKHFGSYHLFGHSHGNLQPIPGELSMDVGVDTNNFYPYHISEIIEKMEQIKNLRDIS